MAFEQQRACAKRGRRRKKKKASAKLTRQRAQFSARGMSGGGERQAKGNRNGRGENDTEVIRDRVKKEDENVVNKRIARR